VNFTLLKEVLNVASFFGDHSLGDHRTRRGGILVQNPRLVGISGSSGSPDHAYLSGPKILNF
jgi:hypothetical protein